MTFNIWNYTPPWKERRQLIADLILRHDPDVVCLQETRQDFRFERGKGQGEQLAELTGRHPTSQIAQVYWPFPRVSEGLTILTRKAPHRVMLRRLSLLTWERADENHRICLGVEVNVGERAVHVFNTHFSLGVAARLSNAAECINFVHEQGDVPSLFMGDLNAEPNEDSIRLLRGDVDHDDTRGDFVDCWTSVHGTAPGFTYASFGPVRRIDYQFARNVTQVTGAIIVGGEAGAGVYASDHLGIVVDLQP